MLADPFQTARPSGWVKCVGGCGGDGGNGGFHKDSVRPAASTNMECPTLGHLFPHLLIPVDAKRSRFRDFVPSGTNVQEKSRKRPDLPLKSQSLLILSQSDSIPSKNENESPKSHQRIRMSHQK